MITASTTPTALRGRRRLLVAALLPVAALAGCGQPKGVIFEPATALLSWPPPPEPTRIHYLGELRSNADLKPAKSFFEGVGELFFGAKEAKTMLTPYAVARDGDSRVFVCDSNAQLVHVFDLESRAYEQWRPDADGVSFAQPVGIAFDTLDRLLVSDSVQGTIHVFNGSGQYAGDFGSESLERPAGLAVDPATGRIFAADTARHQVAVLAVDGELLEYVGARGTGPGEFNYPTNVAVDTRGRLYVSDSLNFRVQVFDRDLRFERQIGSKGDMPGYFSQPKGIALDTDDHVYVVDAHFESVQIYSSDGDLLLTFGEEGYGPGQFWLPAGICIDRDDRIWVTDPYNRRVQVFEYRPEVLP